MTLDEFRKKWGDIPTKHAATCDLADGFDWGVCTCGHDALWAQRNEDLGTVDPDEVRAFHESLLRGTPLV